MSSLPAGISVVVPVFNSAQSLPELASRVGNVLQARGGSFEMILVNDGSHDSSWDVVQSLSRDLPWVRGICLMRNYGQHNALLAGIRAAAFGTVVTLDDDLQHPPELLPVLLAKLEEGYDVVYGPPEQEQHGLFRDIASFLTKVALKSAMGADSSRDVSAWRVFRTSLRDAFERYHSPFVSVDVLLTWGASRTGSVRVRHDPRTIGKSNYTFRKLVRHALNMMTGFSVVPLQLASLVGFVFTLFGIGVLSYVLGSFMLHGTNVAGFPFLASVIAIFSGAQLFALGIIGEYLARMHFSMMDKPAYTVRSTSGSGPAT